MTTLGSNTGYFRFDDTGKTMQYISQSHYFQSWALSNTSSFLTNASALPLHQTTMTILAGSVGIGTSTPQATLDISGNMKITSTSLVTNLNADKLDGQDGSFYQNAANITSGTLSVSRGGTGLSNITTNKLMVGNGTSAISTPTNLHWDGANLGIGTANPLARMHVYGNLLLEMENAPLRLSTLNSTSVAPYFYSLGKRSDGNTSYAFAGRIALAKNRTDDATSANSTLGMVAFGGNHTDGGESNVAFTSSIIGISDASFSNSNAMPISIAFCTGSNSYSITTNNVGTIGAERMRIHSGGNVGIGSANPVFALDVKGSIRSTNQLISTVGVGTAPLSVASTTLVTNLNADKLDGQDGSYYQNASNINSGVLGVTYGGIGTTVLTTNKLLVGNSNLALLSPVDLHWTGANLGIGTTTPRQKLDVIGSIQASSQLISTVGLGTAPLSVASTTLVTNLNADKLDGQDGSYYQNASNINSGVLAVSYGGIGTTVLTANKLLVGNSNLGVLSPVDLHWTGTNLGIGTVTPTAKLDVVGSIQASSQLISTVGLGTAPLSVASATLVSNLNADKLDGEDGAYYQNATNINAGTLSVAYGGTGNNALTANKILVGNGSNGISSPSNLHWTGTNLGIGTTTPQYTLDVNGQIVARDMNGVRLRQSSYSGILRQDDWGFYYLLTNANDPDGTWNSKRPLQIDKSTGNVLLGNQALTVVHSDTTSAGYVGIGGYPSEKLDVSGVIRSTSGININVGNTGGALTLTNTVGGAANIGLAAGGFQYSTSAIAKDLVVRSSYGRLILQSGDGGAGLMIGTQNMLYIFGNGWNTGISFQETEERIYREGTSLAFHCSTNHGMIFYSSGGNVLMRLNGPGNGSSYVMEALGTVRATGSLEVVGTIKATGSFSTSITNGTKWFDSGTTSINNWNNNINNKLFSIDSTNGVLSRAYGFYATSDVRNKCDIVTIDLDAAASMVRKLRVVNYRYKSTRETCGLQTGFIAQEVETVYPLAVSQIFDKVPDMQCNAIVEEINGNTIRIASEMPLPSLGTKITIVDAKQKEWVCRVERPDLISCETDLKDFDTGSDRTFTIYGTNVDDFRILDKDALYTLNVAAMQQAFARIDALEAQNKQLTAEISAIRDYLGILPA